MISLTGYEIREKIYEGTRTIVYRGHQVPGNQAVVVKTHVTDYPTPAEVTRFRREYEIGCQVEGAKVIKYYGMEEYGHGLALVTEDFGAVSMKSWLPADGVDVATFLEVAMQLAEALEAIHQQNIIHKDLKPSHILINPDTNEVKVIDFGLASQLGREMQQTLNPNRLEGTLAYMSPEQTGRMNRAIDYRTDFYSLGVVFYELLTGQLPFATTDPMELVHSHLAKTPAPPDRVKPEIPPVLSELVLKLLAKTAEARYQSAAGLKADLQSCQKQWQTSGDITPFPLARQDVSDKFQIPQKLYGRQPETEALLAAFNRVAARDRELMLVLGPVGIGKSALVQGIQKPIIQERGYFITGKFDQLQRNIPYRGLAMAFQDLVQQLLTESEAQLKRWQERLSQALGANGQVIIDIIPEVELIIGPQPPVPELGSAQTQNRFTMTFQDFIRVFCQPDHPLVIFLNNLQWADAASLNLLEWILTDEEINHLLVIGAYRDSDVSDSLRMALETLQRIETATVNKIELTPLKPDHITDLIAETLHHPPSSVASLAELVTQKTNGNPFFVNQFLQTMYQEHLLTFNYERLEWEWDLEAITAMSITDNVVTLMVDRLKKLPVGTQQVLKLAACVGNSFDLDTLAVIQERAASEIHQDLEPAVTMGLILRTSRLEVAGPEILASQLLFQHYQFLHDRVRQAAYALLDEEEKQAVHLQIGRLLLASTSEETLRERLFEVVDHLNIGQPLITDESESITLARLNLAAGEKAKKATAYPAALTYLKASMACLTNMDLWADDYDLALALHKEQAEVEYLNGNFEQSEALVNTILDRAQSPLEKAEIYITLIIQYTLTARYQDAIETGRKALSLLDTALPTADLGLEKEKELAKMKELLGDREIASLYDAPEMTAPEKRAALHILSNIAAPVFYSDPDLYPVVVLTMVNLSLEHGHTPVSAFAYANYGAMLCSSIGEYKSGYEFGLLATRLSEKFSDRAQKCKSSTLMTMFISHWSKHLKQANSLAAEGFQAGLESGDLQFAAYIARGTACRKFDQGDPLMDLLPELKKLLQFAHRTKNRMSGDIILAVQLVALNLTGQTQRTLDFHDDEMSDTQYQEVWQTHKSMLALVHYQILKSQALYLYGQFESALEYVISAEQLLPFILGLYLLSTHNFYHSLTLAALYPEAPPEKQEEYWTRLEANQEQMKIWADHCPENFLHRYLLVMAEMARIGGRNWEAMGFYTQAIESARENEFIQNEALANELAARFWLGQGEEEYAQTHLVKAHYGYRRWGATRKATALEADYPHWLGQPAPADRPSALDLNAVMKASQTISGEINLDKLLVQLMTIVMENAGAEKGFLVLDTDGQLRIEAAGAIDETEVAVRQSLPIEHSDQLSEAIVRYVARTGENLVLHDAVNEGRFTKDAYVRQQQPRSILCMPLHHHGQLSGVLYLENNLTSGAFTPDRLETLGLLSAQATISLENAKLYDEMTSLNTKLRKAHDELKERAAELQREIAERERAEAERERLQQEVIEAQQRALQELSMPIIPVMEHIIVMPLIGGIDAMRARDITRALLAGIREHQAKAVILDITGVPVVDSGVAAYLNKTIQAARLKGARTIVTGISEAVAETIVDLGIDWSGIETLSDLQTGLRSALAMMGRRIEG